MFPGRCGARVPSAKTRGAVSTRSSSHSPRSRKLWWVLAPPSTMSDRQWASYSFESISSIEVSWLSTNRFGFFPLQWRMFSWGVVALVGGMPYKNGIFFGPQFMAKHLCERSRQHCGLKTVVDKSVGRLTPFQ